MLNSLREDEMKLIRILAVVLVIMGSNSTVNSQQLIPGDGGYKVFADLKSYQEVNLEKYGKNFLGSLNYSSCNDIIESGLAQVCMWKLAQPNSQQATLKNKIDDLAIRGDTPAIRYKAYLTSMVFEHPELFVFEKYGEYKDGNALFTALAQRLQEALASR